MLFRSLALELSSRGVELVDGGSASSSEMKHGRRFYIVDLDFCAEEQVSRLAKSFDVIGFSGAYKNELDDMAKHCKAFLHRPFLIDDLISVMFEGEEPRKKRDHAPSKMKKHSYLTVDAVERCAVFGKERIMLTDGEYKVLSLLCEKRGEAVSREEISLLLGTSDSNNCDVYICMLRRKIDNRLGLKLINTVRGKGYMIVN